MPKKLSIEQFWTFMNSLEIQKETNRQAINTNIVEENGQYKLKVAMKSDRPFILPQDMDDSKQIVNALRQRLQEQIYDEPPDHLLKDNIEPMSVKTEYEELPEYYSNAIYPASCRPNIEAIKVWVRDVKIPNMSQEEYMREVYGDDYESRTSFSDVTKLEEKVVDQIAYKISRKIWYVGRRPSNMTDGEWNEVTKNMRPPEGSYGKGDTWVNFKYGGDYQYSSGVT